jgi:DNA polymerase
MGNEIGSGRRYLDNLLALLRLQWEWGADEAIGLEPLDRSRVADAAVPVVRAVVTPPVNVLTASTAERAAGTAERAAGLALGAATLESLRAALAGFDGCGLRDTASHLVFAEGDASSTTLIIGEAPGREEDRSGHAFAGPEGALLDQMLGSIGLERGSLMLAPLLPWRPPGGRPVNAGELLACLPFLHRLIVLLGPRRLVIFGGTATRALLGPVRRRGARGWVEVAVPGLGAPLPGLALPGLADMLKTPLLRRDAWAGLRLLRRALDDEATQS